MPHFLILKKVNSEGLTYVTEEAKYQQAAQRAGLLDVVGVRAIIRGVDEDDAVKTYTSLVKEPGDYAAIPIPPVNFYTI